MKYLTNWDSILRKVKLFINSKLSTYNKPVMRKKYCFTSNQSKRVNFVACTDASFHLIENGSHLATYALVLEESNKPIKTKVCQLENSISATHAELLGILYSIRYINKKYKGYQSACGVVYCDNMSAIDCINKSSSKGYKSKELQNVVLSIKQELKNNKNISINLEWAKGHNPHEVVRFDKIARLNKRADLLAKSQNTTNLMDKLSA